MSNICCPSNCLPAKCIAATPRCANQSNLTIGKVAPNAGVTVLVGDAARDLIQEYNVTATGTGDVIIDTTLAPGVFYDGAILFISIENNLIEIDGELVECLKVPVKAIRNQSNSVIWKSSQTLQLP